MQVDGYEFDKLLGQGGMGVVFAAHDIVSKKKVAIKVLNASSSFSDKELLGRFKREVKACSSLSHPNVVPYLADGVTEDGSPFLVMEYVDGQTLQEIVSNRGPLGKEQWLEVAQDLAEALAHCHNKGLVHRDIKPGNILISKEGRAILIDFGLVQADAMTRLTATGMRMGTVECMAPEQLMGKATDRRTDIYALGITLHFALTGHWLYSRDELLSAASGSPMPIHEASQPVIGKCCQIKPERRFQDANEISIALDKLRQKPTLDETIQVSSPKAQTIDEPKTSGKPWRAILATASVLFLIFIVTHLLTGSNVEHIPHSKKAEELPNMRQLLLKQSAEPTQKELELFGRLLAKHKKLASSKSADVKALLYLQEKAEDAKKLQLSLLLFEREGLSWSKNPWNLAQDLFYFCNARKLLPRLANAGETHLQVKREAVLSYLLSWTHLQLGQNEKNLFHIKKGLKVLEVYEKDFDNLRRFPNLAIIYMALLKERGAAERMVELTKQWEEHDLGKRFLWTKIYFQVASANRSGSQWPPETIPWLRKAWDKRANARRSIKWDVLDKLIIALTGVKKYEEALLEIDKEPLENFKQDNRPEVLIHKIRILEILDRDKEALLWWNRGKVMLGLHDTSLALQYEAIGRRLKQQ